MFFRGRSILLKWGEKILARFADDLEEYGKLSSSGT